MEARNIGLSSVDLDTFESQDIGEPPFKRITKGCSCRGIIFSLTYREEAVWDSSTRRHITQPPLLTLWNPSTRKHKILPELCPVEHICFSQTFGFGYDSRSDDYKVVRVVQYFNENENNDFLYSKTNFFSLNSNTWEDVEIVPDVVLLRQRTTNVWNVCLNDALHMLTRDHKSVIGLDLESGMQYQVALPDLEGGEHAHVHSIFVLGGCLAAYVVRSRFEREIWTMREYGVKESWTLLMTYTESVLLHSKLLSAPLAYTKQGDGVLINIGHRYFVIYNLRTQSLTTVFEYDPEMESITSVMGPHVRVFVSVGSLVSLDGPREVADPNSAGDSADDGAGSLDSPIEASGETEAKHSRKKEKKRKRKRRGKR